MIDWPVDGLHPREYPHQPRVDQLATSIQELGIQKPIKITPEGVIIDGHHRAAAAKLLGMGTVPVEFGEGTDLLYG